MTHKKSKKYIMPHRNYIKTHKTRRQKYHANDTHDTLIDTQEKYHDTQEYIITHGKCIMIHETHKIYIMTLKMTNETCEKYIMTHENMS